MLKRNGKPLKRTALRKTRTKERRVAKKAPQPFCWINDQGFEVLNTDTLAGRTEYKARVQQMAERQGWICPYCLKQMKTPTFDHENGRGAGKQDDRIWIEVDGVLVPKNYAMHGTCNRMKGSVRMTLPHLEEEIRKLLEQ